MFMKSNKVYRKPFLVAFAAYNAVWFFGDDATRLVGRVMNWIF